ncbi:alpha/beta fold hydrolase [Tamlana crocina]
MTIEKNIVLEGKHGKPILADVFFEENNTPKPIIIFCHGYKGFKDWGAWDLMAKAFAASGFFFIKFNFSHNGGTVDQPIDFLDLEAFGNNNYTKELDDLQTVMEWVSNGFPFKNEANTGNINLLGHSRAGGIVTIKAEEDHRIKRVISLAGVSDYASRGPISGDAEKWKKEGVKYVVNGRTKQNMPHYYQFYADFKNNEERLTIKRAVSKLNIPFLIIHGNEDPTVLVSEAHNLKRWKPDSTLKIIEGADHVFGASHPYEKERLPNHLSEAVQEAISFLTPNE